MKKLTKEQFIVNFKKKFPNKHFDFSESAYENTKVKIHVKCEKGHIFEIRPNDLMNGYGCNICGGTKKMNNDDFIKKANKIHNGYFSYEHTFLKNVNSKVIVTCPIHGDIEVKANNHLNGANCRFCSKEKITHKISRLQKVNSSTKKLSSDDFKQKLYNKWGEKYTVKDNEEYIKNNVPIMIICKEHGEFPITPNHILSGQGCPICSKNKKKTREEIIQCIKKAQPYSDYDFSKVVYRNIHTPIELKCNKCGTTFFNSPSNLIFYKNGCQGCNQSSIENEIEYILQDNKITYEKQKTFGWLKYKRLLRLDFYLPDYKLAIECQGIQHFKEIVFGNNRTCLKEDTFKDNLKRKLCKENNVNILYYANYHIDFPYKVYEDKKELIEIIKSYNYAGNK